MRFLLLVGIALASCLAVPRHSIAAEAIQAFDATAELARDGSLTVTERIRVEADGTLIRHGITRDFPLTFTDARNRRHDVSFTVLEATRDGIRQPYSTVRISGKTNVARVFLADMNVSLPAGVHTYVIRYRTEGQLRWFDRSGPALNWNVTGNFRAFPILSASYRLELPEGTPPERWTAYTGGLGQRGTDWRGVVGADGALTVSTTRTLGMQEGLTVVAAVPDGVVTRPPAPTPGEEFWSWAAENWIWLYGGATFLVLLIYYSVSWVAVGHDPKPGIIIPLFHPPPGISPALAAYIRDSGFSSEDQKWRAFTAACLSLAVKGRLRFDNGADGLILRETADPVGTADLEAGGERTILEIVQAEGGTLVVDKDHGKIVARLGERFTDALASTEKHRFFRLNVPFVFIGALISMAWFFSAILGAVSLDIDVYYVVAVFVYFVLLFALTALFAYLMRAPTIEGRKALDQLDGLKLYLETAESDRLNHQAPEITSDRFDALLPYAVALGVEKPWADAFAAAIRRAQPADADAMNQEPARWSLGSQPGSDFSSALASTVQTASAALSSSVPVSSSLSGFSSGSGVGGGGGGGGGC